MNQVDQEGEDLRPEYDFSGGVRGKHHAAYKEGTNVVLLDADVANGDNSDETRARHSRTPPQ